MIERRSKLTPSSARRIRVRPSAAARKLDAYYTSRQRKDDYAMAEAICIDGGMTKLMLYHDDHGWTYTPEE